MKRNLLLIIFIGIVMCLMIILNKDNKIKTDGYIFNGDKIKVSQNNNTIGEYVILIVGDVSGDGQISPLDYIKIKKYIVDRSNNRYSITYNANGGTGSINSQIVLMWYNYNEVKIWY